uniref:Uncharacterized protein n=1 Tax=Glossina austeni TaxID=7395 RepID=A0A1A9UEC5_GLOAU
MVTSANLYQACMKVLLNCAHERICMHVKVHVNVFPLQQRATHCASFRWETKTKTTFVKKKNNIVFYGRKASKQVPGALPYSYQANRSSISVQVSEHSIVCCGNSDLIGFDYRRILSATVC